LSDEELVQRWAENVVWQHFSGMAFYEPRLPCDATQIGRFRWPLARLAWRNAQGHHRHGGCFQGHPTEFERLIVDTTV
jgi:IS5 family transposase